MGGKICGVHVYQLVKTTQYDHSTQYIMTRRHLIATSLSLMLTAMGFSAFISSCSKGQGTNSQAEVPELPVRTLATSDFSLDNSYPAVFYGENDAEIHPKVSGLIKKVYIDEGQRVRVGEPLFQLDDVTYRAAASQASASLSAAEASLATARLNYKNSQDLLAKNIISQSNFDEVANALKSAEANLEMAKANLISARESLSYCTVTSPVAGVVGAVRYTSGNLVGPETALTQVSSTGLVYVYFSISERQFLALSKGGTSEAELAKNFPPLRLRLADGSIYPEKGIVKGITGVIDRTTGSISLRVDFPNPNGLLRSGGTGTILVPTQTQGAILIPQTSVVEMLHKKFVYTVDKDGKLTFTEITVSPIDDGQNYTVTSGLKAGDQILIAGTTGVKEGDIIKPLTEEAYAKQQEAIKQQMMGTGASAGKH